MSRSSVKLEKILNSDGYSDRTETVKSLQNAADHFYEILNSDAEKINVLSHLADADGFGFEITMAKGAERILNFMYGFQQKEVHSHRVMSLSSDPNSEDNLTNLMENEFMYGETVIGDLPTINPTEANKVLDDALIVDHHPAKEGFDDKFTIFNPHLQGVDGGKEMSASMSGAFILNMVFEKLEKEHGGDKNKKSALKKLRSELDYLSLFGISGSKADMQEDTGLNKAMYEFLEGRGIIKKVQSPFYGYDSKATQKVWAQSNPLFNFMYTIPSVSGLNRGFEKIFNGLSKDRETLVDKLHSEFRHAFVESKENGIEINMPYLNTLSDEDLKRLNGYTQDLTGSRVVISQVIDGSRELALNSTFTKSSFSHHTDDVREMDSRIKLALKLLGREKNSKTTLSEEPDMIPALVEVMKDSFIAFGDREDLEWNLGKLDGYQYVSTLKKGLVNTSIPEIANKMTSMSKLGEGQIFLEAIDEVLDGKQGIGQSKLELVDEKHRVYNACVYYGMSMMETHLLKRDDVTTSQDVHFSNVDFLKQTVVEIEGREYLFGDLIDVRRMNGVLGGIAANTNLLPGGKGIYFTGTTFMGMHNGRETKMVKISGRASDGTKYENIKINRFMNHYGGGGHGGAAACAIPYNQLDKFKKSIGNFDFFAGEFK